MHCVFNSKSDDVDSCLVGHKKTVCGAFKCYRTVGQPCSPAQGRSIGNECADTLMCGCDRKCNGCMSVNGVEICHFARDCVPVGLGKRSKIAYDKQDAYDYVLPEDSAMVNLP